MKRFVPLIVLLALACMSDPIKVNQTNNPEINVNLLFEHEGCRIYRFKDGSESHYYAVCMPGSYSVTTMGVQRRVVSSGKTQTTITVPHNVPTITP